MGDQTRVLSIFLSSHLWTLVSAKMLVSDKVLVLAKVLTALKMLTMGGAKGFKETDKRFEIC